MTLVREDYCLCGHDQIIGILKDYLDNLEEVNHGRYLLDLHKQDF